MGNSSSSSGTDANPEGVDPLDPFDGIETLGYRVLGVQPNSPASDAGLVSFLDFLVGCNGKMLLGSGEDLEPGMEYDDIDLPALLGENKGKELEFLVYNFKSQEARLVNLTPSDTWGGAGLLGVTIRLDNYAGAEDRLVRVLSVEPGSPAAIAGLLAETDFLLGTTHQSLDSVQHLAKGVLLQNIDRVVELYVYNSDTDMVRVVALLPTYQWGEGLGLLGAEVGTGYLHRLPFKARSTEGTCVERKVRYVQGSATKELEQEPQLEMEPPPDDDEVESVSLETPEKPRSVKQPAQAIYETPSPLSTAATPKSETATLTPAEATPTHQRAASAPIPRAPSSYGLPPARSPSSYGLDPKEVQAIFEKPPPTPEEDANGTTPTAATTVPETTLEQPQPAASPQQHQYPAMARDQRYATYPAPVQQHQQPLYYAPPQAAAAAAPSVSSSQSFMPPPPVNTAYMASHNGTTTAAKTTAMSPLGPPPQMYYGASSNVSGQGSTSYNSASSSYSASAPPYASSYPHQPPQAQSYHSQPPTSSHYMSAAVAPAPLPPPPVGYRSQQPLYPAMNPPPQYPSSQ